MGGYISDCCVSGEKAGHTVFVVSDQNHALTEGNVEYDCIQRRPSIANRQKRCDENQQSGSSAQLRTFWLIILREET